ncbi:MAG: AraC family transcriptional regulator [Opitutales bacterium]|nr:AraC family transcriptional regulator [Opitutales bacterium]
MIGQESFRDEVVHRNFGDCPLGSVFRRGHLKTSYGLNTFRTLPHFGLVYIMAGEGFFEAQSANRQKVGSGSVLLLFPDEPHRYGPTNASGWSEVYLLFDGPVFKHWLNSGVVSLNRPVLRAQPIGHWAQRMANILPSKPEIRLSSMDSLATVCSMQTLLSDLLSADQPRIDDSESAWHQQACALLQELPYTGQQAIARQLGCSVDAFRKRFQKLAGISPNRYRQAFLVEQACQLLQNPERRDHEIAERLGFHDAAHFSKFFKASCGQTPSSFRRGQPIERVPAVRRLIARPLKRG